MNCCYEDRARANGYLNVAGVDEVGRGPLAGPVVVAAVILPIDFNPIGINDSKKMTQKARDREYERIISSAIDYSIAIIDSDIIDSLNILNATHKAMKDALSNLKIQPDFALIDGLYVDGLPCKSSAIVGGDSKCLSIACASILAKVTRDNIMNEYHIKYPQYCFNRNKGYGTKDHIDALKKYGPCPIHRYSFAPVRERAKSCVLPNLNLD
ncbi:MAG: ribonuclease HII [Armatimonadota bacterium]